MERVIPVNYDRKAFARKYEQYGEGRSGKPVLSRAQLFHELVCVEILSGDHPDRKGQVEPYALTGYVMSGSELKGTFTLTVAEIQARKVSMK